MQMNNRPTPWQLTIGGLVATVALAGCSSAVAPASLGPSSPNASGTVTASASSAAVTPSAARTSASAVASPSLDPDHCDWLTPAQVTATLGEEAPKVGAGKYYPKYAGAIGEMVTGCVLWSQVHDGGYDKVELSVMEFPSPAAATAWKESIQGGPGCVPLSGLQGKAVFCGDATDAGSNMRVFDVVGARVQDASVQRRTQPNAGLQAQMVALYKQVNWPG